ncbi:MAG: hypothetical protein Q4Q06_02195 [Bacteroidota bacterium]|nr:hypothetical protein [Bacteroidota bacterium]
MYKFIEEIKNIYQKFSLAKIDIPAMINNAVLFVLAWFSVFWVFQFFTMIPAFSLGAKMILRTSDIDFNTMNTASSDRQIWSDTDNIVNIFGTPVIMLSILIVVALIFLIKWKSDRLNIRRYLFWLVICGSVRLAGNYVAGALFGHSFNIWQWYLVTDFLGWTTSPFMKYLFVALILLILYVTFRVMSGQIKLLFNPFLSNRINNLLSSVFLPMLLGCVFILIYHIPLEPFCDIVCLVLMMVYTAFVLCGYFVARYRGIEEEIEPADEKEHINKVPICVLLFFVVIKIIDLIKGGIVISASLYKRFLFENIILFIVAVILLAVLIISVSVYRKRMKRRQRVFLRAYLEQKALSNQGLSEKSKEAFGIKDSPKNMDKYLEGWVDSLDQKEEISNTELYPNTTETKTNVDLDKYKTRWQESEQ